MPQLQPIVLWRTAVMLASLLLLAGCWDNKDINHRSLPIVMGVSMENNQFNVYLDIPTISAEGGGMKVVKGTGNTISEIIDDLSADIESQVDLLHLKIIVVDKKYAQKGLKDSIYTFMRSRDISAKTILIVSNEDLDTFFKDLNDFSQDEEITLYNYFQKNAGWNPQITDTRIWQVFRSINSYTHDVVAPLVRTGGTTPVDILGSAVFKNGKMVDEINTEETLLINAFNGISAQGKIEVMNKATVQIISSSLSHKTSVRNGVPYLNSKLKLKVTLLDTKGDPSVEEIKNEVQTLLCKRVKKFFAQVQQDQADVLGIGQLFRTKLSRPELAHWREEYYPRMELNLSVHTDIQNLGNLRTTE
ncbi:Ger(x)C family spore germination protein [Paenibacillus physcomitrellae]|uniref:Spore germination protein A3 n=1 Tax=Paenibacillus physcomitrellae TaxID=1619311 RepID=A0ABQ1FQJ6_9BACL|nr:Ger(x)C family spore germination protein [Paenibacillus physcomitrellae]GGA24292.1 spore germination protein A3 [Paenibacillus physcomitrellae]